MDSPFRWIPCDQQRKCIGQQTPPLERLYVALPGHPLYGQAVLVVRRRTTNATPHCQVQDPKHPEFCYQILERWLSSEPPPAAACSPSSQRAIALSLVALDQFVQLLLAHHRQLSESHEGDTTHSSGADLAASSSNPKSTA